MILSGIDEAGRGPVLGPMVISVFTLEREREWELRNLKVKDSKKILRKKREEIFESFLRNNYKFDYLIILPEEIDKFSLNKIFMEKAIYFIKNTKTDEVYLDAPCQNMRCEQLSNQLSILTGKKIVALNKGDEKILVVSAASIVSKVLRDREIEKLHKVYGDFGSGYPSDVKTIIWLKKNKRDLENLKILRKKWKMKNL